MIRRGVPDDAAWIRETAAHVYAQLGDYRSIIPSWMSHPGVLTFLDVDDSDTRRGFILLGFYEPEHGAPDTGAATAELSTADPASRYVADLIAIAVAPEHQRAGTGRRLLEYAIDLATLAGRRVRVPEMRLTVAETNAVAMRLFRGFGFEVLDPHHGAYDGGQRAIRMWRRLT
jgi:ribosomal protein S18 acetylase RimI-like enzyme